MFLQGGTGQSNKEKQKKKATERQAARKAEEAKTDLPDVSEVDLNSDSDTDEEDSPGVESSYGS